MNWATNVPGGFSLSSLAVEILGSNSKTFEALEKYNKTPRIILWNLTLLFCRSGYSWERNGREIDLNGSELICKNISWIELVTGVLQRCWMSAEADRAMCFVTVAHATSHGDPGPQRHTARGGTGSLEKLEAKRGWQSCGWKTEQGKITGNLSCSFGPIVLQGTVTQS